MNSTVGSDVHIELDEDNKVKDVVLNNSADEAKVALAKALVHDKYKKKKVKFSDSESSSSDDESTDNEDETSGSSESSDGSRLQKKKKKSNNMNKKFGFKNFDKFEQTTFKKTLSSNVLSRECGAKQKILPDKVFNGKHQIKHFNPAMPSILTYAAIKKNARKVKKKN